MARKMKQKKKNKVIKKNLPKLIITKDGKRYIVYKNKRFRLESEENTSDILKNIFNIIKEIKPKTRRRTTHKKTNF
jgi:hypothetical protein